MNYSVLPWPGEAAGYLIAQEKFDGWFGALAVGGGEPPTLIGRGGRDWIAHVPHIVPSLGHSRVVFFGEILPPAGYTVQAMQSILGGSVAGGQAWQREHGLARFIAFDTPSAAGFTFLERLAQMSTVAGLTVAPVATYAIDEFYRGIVAAGGEGVVIRDNEAPCGERVWKRKPIETIDAVVTHFGPGCSVAFVAFNGGTARVAIPSAIERKDIARDPSRFIGKCLEFQAFGDTDGGKKRSPKFLRWRFDKPARG